ncbi:MAG: hypothetical protein ACKO91_02320 [Acidimicrobiales bacterium]
MALYVSAGRRRRRLVVATVVALLVGSGAGFAVGRWSAPSVAAAATTARSRGEALATRLEALTIEYEQVLKGLDSVEKGVLAPLDEIATGVERAGRDAPWVDAADLARVRAALDTVRTLAQSGGSAIAFADAASGGATVLRDVFGAGT